MIAESLSDELWARLKTRLEESRCPTCSGLYRAETLYIQPIGYGQVFARCLICRSARIHGDSSAGVSSAGTPH